VGVSKFRGLNWWRVRKKALYTWEGGSCLSLIYWVVDMWVGGDLLSFGG
jgi:hypothetical protein